MRYAKMVIFAIVTAVVFAAFIRWSHLAFAVVCGGCVGLLLAARNQEG